jgi:23S rRNA (pseudouridine1915-N3)-methyltransferase
MKITILAVGRARAGAARDLYDDYVKRMRWSVTLREVDLKKPAGAGQTKAREAELLLEALPPHARVIALDERGKQISSAEFATAIGDWRDGGDGEIVVIIGGADGLDERVRARADLVISLGRVTWPHMLVRGMIAEQLYRAQQILAGHPYHRE